MITTDPELARSAEVFGCGRGLDLLERLAATPDGIGTLEVSLMPGAHEQQGHRLAAPRHQDRSRVPGDPLRARSDADPETQGIGLNLAGGAENRSTPSMSSGERGSESSSPSTVRESPGPKRATGAPCSC